MSDGHSETHNVHSMNESDSKPQEGTADVENSQKETNTEENTKKEKFYNEISKNKDRHPEKKHDIMNVSISKLKYLLRFEKQQFTDKSVDELIKKFIELEKKENFFIQLKSPVTLIGDIHGQYEDLLTLLSLASEFDNNDNNDNNSKHKLLFMGDYVDRGSKGVEVMLLLMRMKVEYPERVFLMRGNHESQIMAQCFNFEDEVFSKFPEKYASEFYECFMYMPYACIVNEEYFCVHGGIGPRCEKINIKDYYKEEKGARELDIPNDEFYRDLMWADPTFNEGGIFPSKKETEENFARNCSVFFGKILVEKFLKNNKLRTIIRAHEVEEKGFKEYDWKANENTSLASVYTIFSAPNYCTTYGNKGAILKIEIEPWLQMLGKEILNYYILLKPSQRISSTNRLSERTKCNQTYIETSKGFNKITFARGRIETNFETHQFKEIQLR